MPCSYSYLLVLHKHGELLYEGVTAVIKDHLAARVERGVAKAPNERLLSELEALWSDHKRDMRRICEILMYMVRARERCMRVSAVHACSACLQVRESQLLEVGEGGTGGCSAGAPTCRIMLPRRRRSVRTSSARSSYRSWTWASCCSARRCCGTRRSGAA